ncbi:PITH domain-containing protein GA19395 [Rhagoletis pomonella]|uniref:PITH domain-containing protein GA19395 n=1 Tax=Rhagoletis pomonella TaxID=28610 RepID=UPI0017837B74|nr:PITH domain-containing protein GA19395 [Rhagoletis pomonella]
MPDGHSHNHGQCCGNEATDVDHAFEMGIEYSLYKKIDMDNLECLNEECEGSGKKVFKAYENRQNHTEFVTSDADEEMLFNIPFTGNIKLKGIIIVGADDNTHPSKVRLFKNRQKMTFDDARGKPDQEFDLSRDPRGDIEYSPKVVTFSSVHHLSLHFPSNYGDDVARIYYIGLRGEFNEAHYHGVTICTYEARPNVSDHKTETYDAVNRTIQ